MNRKDNSILEVDEVLRLVDQNTEKLDGLFKVSHFANWITFKLFTKLRCFEYFIHYKVLFLYYHSYGKIYEYVKLEN